MSFEVLTDKIRVARKDHRCIWCGEEITKGGAYQYQTGIFDGDFQSNHWHIECLDGACEYGDLQDGFDPYVNPRGGHP